MVRYCDQCGSKLKPHASYCPFCGAKSDLPPETNIKMKSIDKANKNMLGSKNTDGFNFNNMNLGVVLKYSIVGVAISLVLGIILFGLSLNTVNVPTNELGFMPYAFILALIFSVALIAPQIKDKITAIISGLIIGLLTGVLQTNVIGVCYGTRIQWFFSMYVSDQTFYFIILGIITAYLSNVFLKDKINLSNIKSIHKIKK